jgi:hypothetical protein
MTISALCVGGTVRVLNACGRTLRRIGADPPSLDLDDLLAAARRRAGATGLGAWPIDEPLERLLRSYHDDARLTTLGRITVRELIVSLLENLVRLESELRAHPEIEREHVGDPLFIVGLPRTGTTHLHNVVSRDPDNRTPLTWEVMYPATREETAAGIERVRARTRSRLDWANRLAPEFVKIHPIAPDLPQECIAIHAQAFMGIQFHTTHDVSSYEDWFESASHDLAYDFHHRLLQHLQTQRPGRRWVLKAPGHLFSLMALLKRYPSAKIVQTHRDPLRVMASMASHATVLRRAFSDATDPVRIAADWAERWARALDEFLAVRDRAPAAQFLDVSYDEIERAPLTAVERVYDFAGFELRAEGRAAMQAFLDANPKDKHGAHRYTLEQFGLERDALTRRFARYCERFDLQMGR